MDQFFKCCFKTGNMQFVFTSLDLLNEELAKIVEQLKVSVRFYTHDGSTSLLLEIQSLLGYPHLRLRSAKLAEWQLSRKRTDSRFAIMLLWFARAGSFDAKLDIFLFSLTNLSRKAGCQALLLYCLSWVPAIVPSHSSQLRPFCAAH